MRRTLHPAIRALGMAAALWCAVAPAAEIEEYRAKAVFLYKFATFVEWPAEALRPDVKEVSLCLLGESRLGQTLVNTVRDKQVEGRGFVVRQVTEAKHAAGCHVLFVTRAGTQRFRAAFQEWKALSGLLVVGEAEGFAAEGAVINFKLSDGRLLLQVNLTAARERKLALSSRLLAIAEVVGR